MVVIWQAFCSGENFFSPWSNYTSEFLLDFVINSSPNEGTFYCHIGIYMNIEIVDKFNTSVAASSIDE